MKPILVLLVYSSTTRVQRVLVIRSYAQANEYLMSVYNTMKGMNFGLQVWYNEELLMSWWSNLSELNIAQLSRLNKSKFRKFYTYIYKNP